MDGGLRRLFRERLPQFDWTSIESGGTGRGIPDSNACCKGIEFWVEFKQTTGHVVSLRPEQCGWIARRCRAGGRVWIAVRQRAAGGPRREARDVLWLIPGCHAQLAKQIGLKFDQYDRVLTFHNGPSNWDWKGIAQCLIS